ncbi:MAG: hypothetical protein A3I89_01360 [Candidatus Harrisonbacteria bacterium RIFCSPLOWO2_02_FULL_41_11]|uniref:dTDP-4-dehydrorhamnose reductase n=1 Tax=Candidatus Harrisonbacteria bacterium RIFCSPHIGHO2_02_FULL_42_16 TaxID=1798404 RepID=A0A1G1ZIR6_9BACT|nr:MAG: hypothetical protein A3B92_00850 [Candidatus Harrisonbacteria bacterium RIFCSPHIGHO2_02_FULL_42_16]OGY67618.1 MAG: hypothetical protein A3I89_01360 [Candidatus Harrisonbacteria bacterium RIFCSPLOWO2_02_FULL_41_11]
MIDKKEILLITGCGGMLGEAVYQRLQNRCKVYATDINLNEPWLERLDVADRREVQNYLNKVRPDYIVHLAALTDMEYCELNPERAYAVNELGVGNLAEYASQKNTPFVYISTAGVFDGAKDFYNENDAPNPQSVYGKSKYGGELIARRLNKSIMIRAGWMMGGGPRKDKKFINKIIKQLRAGADEIAVVDDKLGTPCYTYDLAKIIEYLLDHETYGLYHGVCDGGASRYEVAEFLVKELNLDRPVKIRRVSSDHFRESYFAPRPASEKLINSRLKEKGINFTRDWKECLKEYVGKFDWNLWDLNTSGMERSFYKNYFQVEKGHWLMRGRRGIVEDILAKLNYQPKATRILDFGCGSGYFVSELAKIGYPSFGVDVSSEAIQYGQRQGIQNIEVLDGHRLNFPDNHFQAVLMLDFLGHLEDETWALKEAQRVLAPGGVAIIMVPAFQFLWGIHDEVAHHFRRYTMPQLLERVRHASKLSVARKTYFNTLLFFPIAAVRLLTRWLKIRNRESDFEINNGLTDPIFSRIFSLERQLLRRVSFPFGVSILLVLQKQKSYE